MLIVISAPELIPHEKEIVKMMLRSEPEVRFHWRKPGGALLEGHKLLDTLDSEELKRVVLHQDHELQQYFPEVGLHQKSGSHNGSETATERFGNGYSAFVSTSFHSAEEVLQCGDSYRYFFCSPVFPSISKQGYAPSNNWNTGLFPSELKQKAVALGGISIETLPEAHQKGFRHFALLGAVWQHGDPVENCIQAVTLCREQDLFA